MTSVQLFTTLAPIYKKNIIFDHTRIPKRAKKWAGPRGDDQMSGRKEGKFQKQWKKEREVFEFKN